MKSREYWERRSGKRLISTLEDADKAVRRLNRDYETSLANIQGEIDKLYGKFADEHGMDVQAVQRRMKQIDYDVWKKRMEAYLDQTGDGQQALSFELELFLLSNRITYLQAIEAEIVANMAVLANAQEREASALLSDALTRNYYETMYDHYKVENPRVLSLMERHSVAISKESVQTILLHPWSGANYSERIWKREYNIAHKVREMVTRNILEGKNVESLATLLANELGKDKKHAAVTLLHTETAYVKGQADLLVYERLGVKEYEYRATLDMKTSKVCRELDGQHFPVKDAMPGTNYPPMHPRCRSTTIAYREDKDGKTRTARDKDGKSHDVPLDMNYEEWYKTYVESDPEYLAKEKAWKNRHSDKRQFERYKAVLGKNIAKNLEEFQAIKYNDETKWNKLEIEFRDENLRQKIKKEYNLLICDGRQGKHLKEHNNYKGESYLLDGIDPQELANKYMLTGEMKRDSKGKWTNKEFIEADKIIGYSVDLDTKEETETKRFSICYSKKKGIHIVPRKEQK